MLFFALLSSDAGKRESSNGHFFNNSTLYYSTGLMKGFDAGESDILGLRSSTFDDLVDLFAKPYTSF